MTYSIIRDTDQDYEFNRRFSGYGYEFNYSLGAWVVSPDGTITFRQVPLTDINLSKLVTDSRHAIGVRGSDRASAPPQLRPDVLAQLQAEQDEKLRQLHDLLIDPIADLLPDDPNQPVVFIPQGELFLVPFPALKNDNGDYLIENHTILTAPSIQVLQLTHDIADSRNGSTTDQAVIVGNPDMPTVTFLTEDGFVDTRLQPLAGALKEANAVSEFLGTSALTGDQATEATVKQQITSADLIHLATHGLLEYGDPRETGTRDVPGAIALTPGSGEDGLLTSAEILQMDLQADLVVLSACDTGRGRITGDGVIGLSRSFIAAGVPSVVVSLWAVPDAPTADLMTEFYRQLDQGQTKAQALRQAMLITMQDHPDPKDWAAFTLIGESE
ncbi:MAG: CHAT domain-containing protein [Leptolyngbya sp. SIOISBB]|nr:CHAT domain-containing protein [Leptolyngbya sp. SIOISBB]